MRAAQRCQVALLSTLRVQRWFEALTFVTFELHAVIEVWHLGSFRLHQRQPHVALPPVGVGAVEAVNESKIPR